MNITAVKTNEINIMNAQSVCYHQNINGKDYFHKEYHNYMSENMLKAYHILHQQYGKKRCELKLATPLQTPKGDISRISYTILPLNPDDIYKSMRKSTQQDVLVTSPAYIGGPTLGEFTGNHDQIIREIKRTLPEDRMAKKNGLGHHNIKVISQKNGVLYLVITDLAMDIMDYIRAAENLGDFCGLGGDKKIFNTPSFSEK